MEAYKFLVVIFLVVIFIVVLPLVSGIGNFGVTKSQRSDSKNTHVDSKREKIKQKLEAANILKFQLKAQSQSKSEDGDHEGFSGNSRFSVDPKTNLKRRIIGKYSKDPNDFDYELDDLIEEDTLEKEQIYKDEYHNSKTDSKGRTYEAIV